MPRNFGVTRRDLSGAEMYWISHALKNGGRFVAAGPAAPNATELGNLRERGFAKSQPWRVTDAARNIFTRWRAERKLRLTSH